MRIGRDAYELAELAERWNLSAADIRSLVGRGILALSVRIVAQPALLSVQDENMEGEIVWVPTEEKVFSGLGDLLLQDAFKLVRTGEARVADLFLPGSALVTLRGGEGITLSHVDLLVRYEHAEQMQRDVIGVPSRLSDAFDFRLFVYNETEFAFTFPQARALGFVLKQTQGGAPDQHYTQILNAVGSSCQRLSSLFSRKPYWTRLVKKTSGRRGWYYLDPDFVIWHSTTG
jgi:predicted nucleotidyltransferase